MSSRLFAAALSLFLFGCSSFSGEWTVTAAQVGDDALPDLDGTADVLGDGTATLILQSGDLDGDYVLINVEGTADETSDDTFSLLMTGFQEVPQNAIFIDLTLDCSVSGDDATCSGLWESLALDSQQVSFELTAR